ncbi:anthranilate synthase, catalytic subunit [Syntrophotalea carbinolica DSM 2380]|uniref:Anthranilate synthase component 1 n=1 Tax=Syntrophotalea carbinolica (strain DSM 2380 / NBRC 103641 / GraBd1) TaxID=338963 RepID=Q3A6L8_SYNC1|nr:anthranilate synthase component I [Syntrophotalea carbinolica]ABA87989.1 anthranilate synthase, catalytic subunit [Syntrophotalea carbinolica DSM 2380]
MYYPSIEEFSELAQQGNLIPVYREILADMETPVSAFRKIDDNKTAFLLESIAGGEKWARYSFLGSGPCKIFRCRGKRWELLDDNHVIDSGEASQPLEVLRSIMGKYHVVPVDGLPRFFGGMVGYCGYDTVRYFEQLPDNAPSKIGTYDACFILTEKLLIFDNLRQVIKVVCNVHVEDGGCPATAYKQGVLAIDQLVERLRRPLPGAKQTSAAKNPISFSSNYSREAFMAAVERCKEYVRAGDIIQVVLSQRFSGVLGDCEPFDIYRALRTLNPSPYMFFLRFDDTLVIGASPEVLVRKEGTMAEVRPIAGTRPRGRDAAEDLALEKELLEDPKELAEHIMLVDLGRNDLGRVCRTGSVEVSELKVIERYSHVMHIVSNVRGQLADDLDAFDVLSATFPAGTLSGAPKIRAMQIIDELEPSRREIYGGAVGYFSFSGNMDMAIAIRTLVVHNGKIHLQAGAGIVADSDPASEYEETLNKARGAMKAVEMACEGLD